MVNNGKSELRVCAYRTLAGRLTQLKAHRYYSFLLYMGVSCDRRLYNHCRSREILEGHKTFGLMCSQRIQKTNQGTSDLLVL